MAIVKIKNLIEANDCLAQIASLSRKLKTLECERDEKIDSIILEYKEDLLELREDIERQEEDLGEFGEINKDLFKDPRSHKLEHGTLGFCLGKKLETVKGFTWKKVLKKLWKNKKRSVLKFEPKIKKDVIKEKWSAKELSTYGMKIAEEDHFSYSLHSEGVE
jgi:phage host-nuclease inhibitor protein Gam